MKENASPEHNVLNERECVSQTLRMPIWNYTYKIVLVFNIWHIYIKLILLHNRMQCMLFFNPWINFKLINMRNIFFLFNEKNNSISHDLGWSRHYHRQKETKSYCRIHQYWSEKYKNFIISKTFRSTHRR